MQIGSKNTQKRIKKCTFTNVRQPHYPDRKIRGESISNLLYNHYDRIYTIFVDQQPPNQPETVNQPQLKKKTFLKIIILLIISVGFASSFAFGFYLNQLLKSEKNVTTEKPSVTQPTTQNNAPQVEQDSTKFLPGKFYFDDTLIAITKESTPRSIVATTTRVQQEKDYAQNTRVSYFNGSNWLRKIVSHPNSDSAMVSDQIIKNWQTKIDSTRVLKESSTGEIQMDNTKIGFYTGPLENEISIRSLPGYTKFLSRGEGSLTIDGKEIPAHILYTHIYSSNAQEIQFYNQPFGLTTDWIAFWDEEGNFYHVDTTSVDKPTSTYQTHKLGIVENLQGQVTKTFDLSIVRDNNNPPSSYKISLNSPINLSIDLTRTNSLNKAPNNSFIWFSGNVVGSVTKGNGQKINGVGLVEYIHN